MSDEDISLRNIHRCRTINAKAAALCATQGATLEDVAIAASYSALDIATAFKGGDVHAAIEWLRTGLDLQERTVMNARNG